MLAQEEPDGKHGSRPSGDPSGRVAECRTAGVSARREVYRLLAAAGLSAEHADELVCAIGAGAVAGARCGVAEGDGRAPGGRGAVYGQGWCDGVTAVAEDLAGAADRLCRQRGGAAALPARHRAAVRSATAPVRPGAGEAVAPERAREVVERRYAALAGRIGWDRETSRETPAVVLRCVGVQDRAGYPDRLEAFARNHRERLTRLYRTYGPGGLYPGGVCQPAGRPESLVVCERLDSAPLWLEGVWGEECDETPLERLGDAWRFGI